MSTRSNIKQLMSLLPRGYQQACFETKAIERNREIRNPKDLMTLCLMYLAHSSSLLEICKNAELLKICKISDVAFMKRFAKCNEWFKWNIDHLIPECVNTYSKPSILADYKIIGLDASNLIERGFTNRTWRFHYAMDIFELKSEQYKITPQDIGESLTNFTIKPNYIVIADRAYGSKKGIEYCLKEGGNFILRIRSKAFELYDKEGNKINLLQQLSSVNSESGSEFEVYMKDSQNKLIQLRLCAIKKNATAITASLKKIKRRDQKSNKITSSESIALNDYMIVVTSLLCDISADEILALYRLRWQVELYFKRLKSLLNFGIIPNKKEANIEAWLNGKLMLALLIEKWLSKSSSTLPAHDENKSFRSIWRETKFLISTIISNIFSITKLLCSYVNIATYFLVEKRLIRPRLQLAEW